MGARRKAKTKATAADRIPALLVWERPEPQRRTTPEPLSRDAIVRAAITLADADGLTAVSLRNVGAALGAGPMRLYGYVATKEELLDLMADAVYGEMARAAGPFRGKWREALRAMAERMRRAAKQHLWFTDLLSGRPRQGPNALAYLEASLAALTKSPSRFANIDDVILAVGTVNAFVIGAIRNEANELRAERETGLDKRQWQDASWPYLQRMIATGRFPTIERVVVEADHPDPDVAYERGLEIVLDGIATRLRV